MVCVDDAVQSIIQSCGSDVCVGGACVPVGDLTVLCSDTDNTDPSIAGVVTYGNAIYADYCDGPADLVEFGCIGALSSYYMVRSTCPNGCLDGACLTTSPLTTVCTDSDGADITISGSVSIGGSVTVNDVCETPSSVNEYTCESATSFQIISTSTSCPSGVCSGGACVTESSPSCADTDSADDTSVLGTVTYGGSTYEDSCSGADLMQYSCTNAGDLSQRITTCLGGCLGGVCLTPPLSTPTCTDTDGLNVYSEGSVSAGGLTFIDTCFGSSVIENTCSVNGGSTDTSIPCEYGCSGGACLESPSSTSTSSCSDSDGGSEPTIRGQVLSNALTSEDYCSSDTSVYEFSCDSSGNVHEENLPCSGLCVEGACTTITSAAVPSCSDTDEVNRNVVGTVVYGGAIYEDYCATGSVAMEFYCTGPSTFALLPFVCESGTCSGGSCAPVGGSGSASCSDTDGTDTRVQGTTTNNGATWVDSCIGPSSLREFSCGSSGLVSGYYSCIGECADGVCAGGITAESFSPTEGSATCDSGLTCMDTDGTSLTSAGLVTANGVTFPDYCEDDYTVVEQTCTVSGERQLITTSCTSAYDAQCIGGACIVPPTCSESDGGNNPESYGTVSFGQESSVISYSDACVSSGGSSFLQEYYCSESLEGFPTIGSATYTCAFGCDPSGRTCNFPPASGSKVPSSKGSAPSSSARSAGSRLVAPTTKTPASSGTASRIPTSSKGLAPAACTDTDGTDRYQQGTVTMLGGETFIDSCLPTGYTVLEQICSFGRHGTLYYSCGDFPCIDGACYREVNLDGKVPTLGVAEFGKEFNTANLAAPSYDLNSYLSLVEGRPRQVGRGTSYSFTQSGDSYLLTTSKTLEVKDGSSLRLEGTKYSVEIGDGKMLLKEARPVKVQGAGKGAKTTAKSTASRTPTTTSRTPATGTRATPSTAQSLTTRITNLFSFLK